MNRLIGGGSAPTGDSGSREIEDTIIFAKDTAPARQPEPQPIQPAAETRPVAPKSSPRPRPVASKPQPQPSPVNTHVKIQAIMITMTNNIPESVASQLVNMQIFRD